MAYAYTDGSNHFASASPTASSTSAYSNPGKNNVPSTAYENALLTLARCGQAPTALDLFQCFYM